MKLFDVGKIGLYLDTITHSTEKRRDTEVKIVTLVLRVQLFDATLASTMADGVRATLFKLNHPEPKETLRRVEFALGVERQNLHVFAAPDTDQASIVLQQVKITGTYARTEKSVRGYGFVFKASFGPAGRRELEYVQDWHLTQRFVTFEEAEPGLFDDEAEESDDHEPDQPAAPEHMFGGPLGENQAEAADRAHRPLHSHQSKRGARKKAR